MILIAGLVLGLRSAELEDKEIGKGVPVSKEESCEARTGIGVPLCLCVLVPPDDKKNVVYDLRSSCWEPGIQPDLPFPVTHLARSATLLAADNGTTHSLLLPIEVSVTASFHWILGPLCAVDMMQLCKKTKK